MARVMVRKLRIILVGMVLLTACRRERPSAVDVVESNDVSERSSLPVRNVAEVAKPSYDLIDYNEWLKRDFSPERRLFASLRKSLANGAKIGELPKLNIGFDPSLSVTAVTLFQQGHKPIRWISKRQTLAETLDRIVEALRSRQDFSDFAVADPEKCRIMIEVITAEWPIDARELGMHQLSRNRFEPGITGLKIRYKGRSHFYMPTDAAVYSHLTVRHVLNHMSKKLGIAKKTNRISERVQMMIGLEAEFYATNSVAFVSYGQDVLPLYRGFPVPVEFSTQKMLEMAERSVDWVLDNMDEQGKFLYYYDGVSDSVIDHIHPNRTEQDNYYNILRHSGGVIALLRMYELTEDEKYLAAADKALHFLTEHTREHTYRGERAYYVFFNQKAKLGGSGIALVAFLRYYQISGETKYNEYIFGLARHLLSRVTEDGEMLGYYIHPQYNGGQPILSPTPQEKKQLFSFYYPGEAMLGLALFEREMELTDEERRHVREVSKSALDFLVNIRPVRYAELFEPLPSDGWLMQAMEEWSRDEEFRKKEYLDFVFNDARQMIAHMYTDENAPYYDYPGTFYYRYGDHTYPDGARAEGLISAYYLAKRMGEKQLAEYILANCRTVAKSLVYTYNDEKSTFMHRFPEKSIGSFRFKLTRHWVRVDTVQHTACFYARLLSALRQQGKN